ncbi:unnamed protein product [Peniophora sp. CBMAI 1063]|nr:unnamed protein product [Peniophora sp. CBMAI 1063]
MSIQVAIATASPEVSGPHRTHVNDLPPELLVTILMLSMGKKDALYDGFRAIDIVRCAPLDHRLSHVCRRWRTIILSRPGLWSVLPRTEGAPQWADLCLSRCAQSPIEFVVPWGARWDEPECQQAIRSILPHLGRVRTLDLNFGRRNAYEGPNRSDNIAFVAHVARCLQQNPMALLEEVDMEFYWHEDSPPVYDVPHFSAEIFSQGPTPQLRILRLQACIVLPLRLAHTRHLRQLILVEVQCWSNVDDLVRCLQATPCLEQLVYHDYGTDDGNAFFDSTPSLVHRLRCVPLDRLALLRVEGSFNTIVSIFSYLAFPSSACVATFGRDYEDEEQDQAAHFSMLTEALGRYFSAASTATDAFSTADVEYDSIDAKSKPLEGGEINSARYFYLHLPLHVSDENTQHLFNLLDKCASLPAFRHLKLSYSFRDCYPEYIVRFAEVKRLTKLRYPLHTVDS